MNGCAVPSSDTIETPIGNLKVDIAITQHLLQQKHFTLLETRLDEEEHSLEMQYPFLSFILERQKLREKVSIVPIVVGSYHHSYEKSIVETLAPYWKDSRTAFVFSSDFCHYGTRFDFAPFLSYIKEGRDVSMAIEEMDKTGMALIEQQDRSGFGAYLSKTSNTICGRYPLCLLLSLIPLFPASSNTQVRWVKYAQSSRIQSARDSSVSYAAGVVYQTKL